jgi:prepilin-type N-terminal cleavage/methylation domain-containing protein
MRHKSGFTLIELLIVIAIIALLASIILISLGSARQQGADTRVVANIRQIRGLFEQDFAGNYIDLQVQPGTDPQTNAPATLNATSNSYSSLNQLAQDVAQQGSVLNYVVDTDASGKVINYAIYGGLISNRTEAYCMDSQGNTNLKATASSTTLCP